MAQRHLRELLREDQEPFLLESFIEERRGQLQKPLPERGVSVPQNSTISSNLSKTPLLIPINDHATLKRSPLFDLGAKTPPSTLKPTAYLILEAALRIQEKQHKESKSRSGVKDRGFGFFASVLKRLVSRKRRGELQGKGTTVATRDICGRGSPSPGNCCTTLKVSNWSEERALPREGTSSFRTDGNEIVTDEVREMEAEDSKDRAEQSSSKGVFGTDDEGHCSLRTADNRSGACSTRGRERERQLFDGTRAEREYDEEEQKEKEQQLSPVSVLDPTFAEEEDDDEEQDHPEGHVDSFQDGLAIVLKAKQQIMHHLRRFERLAGLDPIQLDKLFRVVGPEDDLDDDEQEDIRLHSHLATETQEIRDVVKDILSRPQSNKCRGNPSIPKGITILISDLVREEKESKSPEFQLDEAALLRKVCRRFEAWKEVDGSTLDRSIESDFTRERDHEWNKCEEQVQDIAAGIEIAIFELLVRELSVELIIY